MLYAKVKYACVPIWLKENEFSSQVITWCKNEMLKTSLKLMRDRIIYFTTFTSAYGDNSAICLD